MLSQKRAREYTPRHEKFRLKNSFLSPASSGSVAGGNIANIGIGVLTHDHLVWWVLVATLVIFVVFHIFVFQKLVKKARGAHSRDSRKIRSTSCTSSTRRGYIIMAIMMAAASASGQAAFPPRMVYRLFLHRARCGAYGRGHFVHRSTSRAAVHDLGIGPGVLTKNGWSFLCGFMRRVWCEGVLLAPCASESRVIAVCGT